MYNAFHYTRILYCAMTGLIVGAFFNSCSTGGWVHGPKKAGNQPGDSIVVDRDGNQYAVKKLRDNNWWMLSNLKLTMQHSYHYHDSVKYDEAYGRLYTWEAAQAGCAAMGMGWRLPGKDDWQQLAENYGAIGRAETVIEKRAFFPLLAGGNSLFNAVLGGGRNPGGDYGRLDAHGFYWTATQHDSATAWFANFAKGSRALYIQPEGQKVSAFSVRCMKSPGL